MLSAEGLEEGGGGLFDPALTQENIGEGDMVRGGGCGRDRENLIHCHATIILAESAERCRPFSVRYAAVCSKTAVFAPSTRRLSPMPYSSAALANRFLAIAEPTGELVQPMKLQKLVYFAHGWHLGLTQRPLCSEFVQAWTWGPVFPELYHQVKKWGREAVTGRVQALEVLPSGVQFTQPDIPAEDTYPHGLCDRIWSVYGEMSGLKLSVLTHEPGSPWHQIRAASKGARDQVIPNDLIARHFAEKIDRNRAARA